MRRALFTSALFFSTAAIAGCGGGETEEPLLDPLALTSTTLPDTNLGSEYSQTLTAKGGVPPYVFSISDGMLPLGIDMWSTGVISGLAGRPGRASFTVKVVDSKGETITNLFSIYVRPDPLTITSNTLPMGREMMDYDQQLSARGGVDPKTWSIAGGTLPQGLTLSETGLLSGNLTEFGAYQFTVQVTDAEAKTAEKQLTLTVISADPMITTELLEKSRLGVPYTAMFAAQGGAPPYTWSIAMGELPEGLNLTTNGTLTGTPLESGIYALSVLCSDTRGRRDMREVTLRVIAPLVITTTQLNQAIHNRAYSFRIAAAGGEEPYTWQITSGNLPAGISFNADGQFSGTTSAVGDYELTIRLTDAEGFTQAAQYIFRVSDRFTFDNPVVTTFPATCTGTVVAYTAEDIVIGDSMQIADLNVTIDVSYPTARDLKIQLQSPWGQRTTLCGGDNFSGCSAARLRLEYDDDGAVANRPDAPLSSFDTYNAQGTWKLIVLVVGPSCSTMGTINTFSMTIEDDREVDDYIAVRGFFQNNLVHYPFVRIDNENVTGDGVDTHELYLSAKQYSVGPNGFREGGLGDDVEDPNPMTWAWVGPAIPGTTLSLDGYVHAGLTTGKVQIIASGGANTVVLDLLVSPPDWNSGR